MEIGSHLPPSQLNVTQARIDRTSANISSGTRINKASDDAAGLAISNRLDARVSGFNQSIRNANDGVSALQVKGAALEGFTDGVQRIRELALQASNGILSDSDRSAINKEAQSIASEIQRGLESTQFNGKPVFSDSDTTLQIGPGEDDLVTFSGDNLTQSFSEAGFDSLDFSSVQGATDALGILDSVQGTIDQQSADIGANLNRLDSTINNLSDSRLSTHASLSRIKDSDMAKEVSELAKEETKRDIDISMQVLANQNKSNVLRLLQQ